ncbi:MAG: hypothetical protein C4523_09420 [Myxococcales bacterium]|nr:MAG: hypothetical protein C4523_09420 [Myxococcales bacterium]
MATKTTKNAKEKKTAKSAKATKAPKQTKAAKTAKAAKPAKEAKSAKPKKTTAKTPVQIVKDRFESKANLVNELAEKLERKEGESKADFVKRLTKVSCTKLLRLHKRAEEAEAAGGRRGLVETLHEYRRRTQSKKGDAKEDGTYKKHLEKKTIGALVDQYKVVRKRTRAKANG